MICPTCNSKIPLVRSHHARSVVYRYYWCERCEKQIPTKEQIATPKKLIATGAKDARDCENVPIWMTTTLRDRIDDLAARLQISRSACVRRIIRVGMKHWRR